MDAELIASLEEIISEWKELKGWVNRPDCDEWQSDIDARENRRECIVYGNCYTAVNQWLKVLKKRVKNERIY